MSSPLTADYQVNLARLRQTKWFCFEKDLEQRGYAVTHILNSFRASKTR